MNRDKLALAIADALERAAPHYPEALLDENAPLAEFAFGRLIIRCRPYQAAVRAVAAKFRKGGKAFYEPHRRQGRRA